MKIKWKMMRKLLLLILIGQTIPELNAQDLNTIDEASKTEVVSQQNSENSDAIADNQKEETVAEELNVSVNQQHYNKNVSENIIKHGIEFSINELNPGEAFDVRKVVSQDEIDNIKKVDKEYFDKKYLNKEVVIIGPLESIRRFSNDYELTINKFAKEMFSSKTSCDFQKDQTENLKMFLQLLTTQNYGYRLVPSNRTYVLIKGTMTSGHSMKNCKIIGLAKTK